MIEYLFLGLVFITFIPKIINMYMNANHKIPISKKYYARFYNGTIHGYNKKIHDDIKTISMNSIGEIAPYSIMEGEKFNEKKFILIYDKNNNPVGMNCFFDWKFKDKIITHLGLYLIDEKHKGNNLQKIIAYLNLIHSISEYRFRIIWTDTGRSPSAWKALDKNKIVKYCYPSLEKKFDEKFVNFSKDISKVFFRDYYKECAISDNSIFDENSFCIKNANNEGGFKKLIEFDNNRASSNNKYNNKMNELCPNPEDILLIVCKLHLFI